MTRVARGLLAALVHDLPNARGVQRGTKPFHSERRLWVQIVHVA